MVERQRNPARWDVIATLPHDAREYVDTHPNRRGCYRVRQGTADPFAGACVTP